MDRKRRQRVRRRTPQRSRRASSAGAAQGGKAAAGYQPDHGLEAGADEAAGAFASLEEAPPDLEHQRYGHRAGQE